MKLAQDTFMKGMQELSVMYPYWSVDVTDLLLMGKWYKHAKEVFAEENFLPAVAYYCQSRAKEPRSLCDIQEALAENVPQMSALEGLNTLKGLLNLFQLDHNKERLVATLTAKESMKALYLTYCNICDIDYDYGYPNSELKRRFEDSYFCTLFITEYKKIQASVLREACRQPITALPSGNQNLMIGG